MTSNTESPREIVSRELYSYLGDGETADEIAAVIMAALASEGWQLVRGDPVAWLYLDKHQCKRVWLNRQSLNYVQATSEHPLYKGATHGQ